MLVMFIGRICPAAGRIRTQEAGSSFRRPQPRDRFTRHRLNLQRPALTDHIDGVVARNLACGDSVFDRLVEALDRRARVGAKTRTLTA
jgi:hypothetical protein